MKKLFLSLIGLGSVVALFFLSTLLTNAISPTQQGLGGTGTSTTFTTGSLIIQGNSGYGGLAPGTNGYVLQMIGTTPTYVATSTLGFPSFPISVGNGGTGTSTSPSFGQLLLGNASGGYNLVATSTLGISSLSGGQTGYVPQWLSPSTLGTSSLISDGVHSGVNATITTATFLIAGNPGVNRILNVTSSTLTSFLAVMPSGKVGINNQNPNFTFDITGDIHASGILYDSSGSAGTNGYVLQTTGSAYSWVATSTLGINGASTSASGSTGSIQFAGSGATFNADQSNLWWNNTSKALGIGTSTPTSPLTIVASQTVASSTASTATTQSLLTLTNPAATASSSVKSIWLTTDDANGINIGTFNNSRGAAYTATTTYLRMFPDSATFIGEGAGAGWLGKEMGVNQTDYHSGLYGILAVGDGALSETNNGLGGSAFRDPTNMGELTVLGVGAGQYIQGANQSTIIGFDAGGAINYAYSTIIGNDANPAFGNAGVTGATMVGEYVGSCNYGAYNTFFGAFAGGRPKTNGGPACGPLTASYNTFVGALAGSGFGNTGYTDAQQAGNIFIGINAGSQLAVGSNNIIIGNHISPPASSTIPAYLGGPWGHTWVSNVLDIGNLIYAQNLSDFSNNYTTVAVDASSTQISAGTVGIGTSTPIAKFAVMASTTERNIPAFVVASSTGSIMFKVDNNASTTVNNLTVTGTCSGCGGSAAGSNKQIQYNNSGSFAGSAIEIRGDASNAFLGSSAGVSLSGGTNNTAVGQSAANAISSGNRNTAMGGSTMANMDLGSDNTFLGYAAGDNNGAVSAGSNNIYIGSESSFTTTRGSANIVIGAYVDPPIVSTSAANQQLNIGNLIYGTGLYNSTTLSSLPVNGKVGIGSSTPSAVLTVQGFSGATTPLFIVSSSTNSTFLKVDNLGHLVSGGVVPTVSSCGSSPNGAVAGTDDRGVITMGGTAPTACTLIFSRTRANNYACNITDDSLTVAVDISSTSSTSTVFGLGVGGLASGHLYYNCGEFTNSN